MQGVIKTYDPDTGDGALLRDTDLAEIELSPEALDGTIFRTLRQGQRVVFDLDGEGRATALRTGGEIDLREPEFPAEPT